MDFGLSATLLMNADNYPKSLVSIGIYWQKPFFNADGRRQLSQIIGIYPRFIHPKNSPKIIRVY
ncbi:hypothetical protein [Anabaena sp. CCY 0017]|uniref:hypothetical protein n=1 Tax=Anabaena sp. CCY 0017 TaxID=3103866 RepID=UPI0039C723BD